MFIPRTGAQLYTLSFGQGPLTLLAVGGWIGSGEIWHPLFGHLPHWRCISVDHRGTGASTRSGPITVDDMADDLLAVADALQVGPCVLAAESAGAAVALRAVQRAPRRFIGQVLVGAAWQRKEAGASDTFIASLRRDYTGTLRSFIDNCLPETDSAALRWWTLQMLTRASIDDAVALIRCREQIAPVDDLARLSLPTLLIHGERDRIAPLQGSRELAERLARAELHVLPGLGHVPIVTAPAQVAALIDEFGKRAAQAA
ncbi:MAG: alpha/beta hydrolase [Rubrivivax sp.]|nr:alpha/beta hydrolase [Rubrivivax sp.]